jgi:hypothetical protein
MLVICGWRVLCVGVVAAWCIWSWVAFVVVGWYVVLVVVAWWVYLYRSGGTCYLQYLLMHIFWRSVQPESVLLK